MKTSSIYLAIPVGGFNSAEEAKAYLDKIEGTVIELGAIPDGTRIITTDLTDEQAANVVEIKVTGVYGHTIMPVSDEFVAIANCECDVTTKADDNDEVAEIIREIDPDDEDAVNAVTGWFTEDGLDALRDIAADENDPNNAVAAKIVAAIDALSAAEPAASE